MYCKYCGYQNNDDNYFCTSCGAAIRETETAVVKSKDTDKSMRTALSVLGFLFPLIGLICWIAMLNSDPAKAKAAGKGTLWRVIVLPALILLGVYRVYCSSCDMRMMRRKCYKYF